MHALLFAAIRKRDGDTPISIQSFVEEALAGEGFVGDEGKYATYPSDWLQVGGRWEGELLKVLGEGKTCVTDGYSRIPEDAMVLSKELQDYIRKNKKPYPEGLFEGECYTSLGVEEETVLLPDAIGKYWVVVVDFHY